MARPRERDRLAAYVYWNWARPDRALPAVSRVGTKAWRRERRRERRAIRHAVALAGLDEVTRRHFMPVIIDNLFSWPRVWHRILAGAR